MPPPFPSLISCSFRSFSSRSFCCSNKSCCLRLVWTTKSGFTPFGFKKRSGCNLFSSSRCRRLSSFSSSVIFGRHLFARGITFPSSSYSGSGSFHRPCFFSMYSLIGPFFGGRPRPAIFTKTDEETPTPLANASVSPLSLSLSFRAVKRTRF